MRTTHDDILRAIGCLEGKFKAFENLPQRIAKLERSQSWLKGGCTALACMFGWLFRVAYGR